MTLWPYPTTACGESRLIWKSQAASRTPNEVLDFWESAEWSKASKCPAFTKFSSSAFSSLDREPSWFF